MKVSEGLWMLKSLDGEELLSAVRPILEDHTGNRIKLAMPESLINPADGHFGYTQLVRIFELIRYVAVRTETSACPDSFVLRRFEMDCLRPVLDGSIVLTWDDPQRQLTSFRLAATLHQNGMVCSTALMILTSSDGGNR